jgi:hypothetical protein
MSEAYLTDTLNIMVPSVILMLLLAIPLCHKRVAVLLKTHFFGTYFQIMLVPTSFSLAKNIPDI